jgi:hypothetical protein
LQGADETLLFDKFSCFGIVVSVAIKTSMIRYGFVNFLDFQGANAALCACEAGSVVLGPIATECAIAKPRASVELVRRVLNDLTDVPYLTRARVASLARSIREVDHSMPTGLTGLTWCLDILRSCPDILTLQDDLVARTRVSTQPVAPSTAPLAAATAAGAAAVPAAMADGDREGQPTGVREQAARGPASTLPRRVAPPAASAAPPAAAAGALAQAVDVQALQQQQQALQRALQQVQQVLLRFADHRPTTPAGAALVAGPERAAGAGAGAEAAEPRDGRYVCCVCMDAGWGAALLPCVHCLCEGCARRICPRRPDGGRVEGGRGTWRCPLCRAGVAEVRPLRLG